MCLRSVLLIEEAGRGDVLLEAYSSMQSMRLSGFVAPPKPLPRSLCFSSRG